MAVEVLEWTQAQDVSFPMEGRLLFAQPADSSWRRGRAVKMSPVSALLVTQGHPVRREPFPSVPPRQRVRASPRAVSDGDAIGAVLQAADSPVDAPLHFAAHSGVRAATLLLLKEKCGRYSLLRVSDRSDHC